ncbi:phytanoyl-CoA dioxygenase [Colletotrichum paranaense]|uniref:Phytanoyl-CoA dioxygenase n=2 Tax=Colletotrichum acutatum species complex TaxID=2707335 RepID=A0AAI9UX33_9PEZI|nr:phytanoyl-CoA dioxygenase [Colletotrichum paranaense]KAK1465065.1 phytanoyl-CoA dioxygenase [Colletotrichum melonis]KAK1541112.1 phytanoyl-CoA dioxygenase [Colletotrichum paranaense]
MATTTVSITEQPSAAIKTVDDGRMKMDGHDPSYGDWRDDLLRDGYAVIKAAIPRERADGYADKMYGLLESFGLGYDRNDPSTVHPDKLPVINEKGMLMAYGACHEDFVWDIRSEPGVVGAFEKVYGTEDLLVSFDVINYGFANRTNLPENKPWPHQDQDPEKPGFRCLQGLVNLHPCGPDDGGLIVCKGSHNLSAQFHKDLKDEPRIPAWTKEWYGFTDRGMEWLKEHGGEWIKVCADPGDLIVWDSRTAHYNVPVKGKIDRMAVYTCFMPVTDATQEDLVRKKAAYDSRLGTTHWPNARHTGSNTATRNGKPDHIVRERPLNDKKLSERAFKLTGIPYIRV